MEMPNPKILMYHGIESSECPSPEKREEGAEFYDVRKKDFEAQMQWIRGQGYKVRTIRELWPTGDKNLFLTFDDGELNNCAVVLPILRAHGFSAHFFLIASKIGQPGYMGWEDIAQLHREGMVIGSHGFSHEILTNLLETQIEQELKASKRYIERNLNIDIDCLSIPRGFCNDGIIKMARSVGYQSIFISERPRRMRAQCLSRIAVKRDWTLERFEQAVLGQVLISEVVREHAKNTAKLILRDSGYNFVRKWVIRLVK